MKPNSNLPNSNLPSGKVEQLLKDITALRDEAKIRWIKAATGLNSYGYAMEIKAYYKSIELINKILNP
jgi:hypothetical protein